MRVAQQPWRLSLSAKGRPSDNPLIVHIAHRDQLDTLVTEVNETAEALMTAFWPGPLTLVLPVRPGAVSPRVTAGLDTVAVRMPDHPVALQLIAAAACPVAAPSANRSGRPSPTLAVTCARGSGWPHRRHCGRRPHRGGRRVHGCAGR